MASPFSLFRRNQRVMLAVFGVLLMIAFVLSDVFGRWGNTRQVANPPVVRTSYGTLTEGDLHSMVAMRQTVALFLSQLVRLRIEAMVTKGEARSEQEIGLYQNFYLNRLVEPILARYHARQPEAAAVETMLLAHRADEMGIVVSDTAIKEYLRSITENQVNEADLQELFSNVRGAGGSVSQRRLMDSLRTELKAARLQQLFNVSLGPLPPGQRWDYYTRLKRQVSAEVMPVPVRNFVESVPDPSEEELQEFFDKHKYRYALPNYPEPGFKKVPRAQFQYFKASYNNFLSQVEVTDEEIEKYYNENKEMFRKLDLPDEPGSSTPASDAGATGDKPADSETAAEETPKSDSAEQPAESSETPAADDAAPKGETTEEATGSEETKSDAESKSSEASPKNKKQSSTRRPVIQLVSADEEQLLAQAETKNADKSASAEPAAGETEQTSSEEQKEATEPEVNGEAAADATADASKSDSEPKTEDAATTAATSTADYEPLDKVRDKIRQTISDREIRGKIDETFDKLVTEMRDYVDQRVLSNNKDYPPFDFEGAAKRYGLDAFETVIVSPQQFDDTDLGRSFILDQTGRAQSTVAQRAFSRNAQEFQPETSVDADNNRYVYWKIKHEAEEVPEFESVRKQVLQSWKMVKARDLARKQAEELAQEARGKEGQTLAATFGASRVRETGKFSWLTPGNTANFEQPRISEVSGVEMPGDDFMRAVSQLGVTEVGVAMNQPETVVYVVRVAEVDLPTDPFQDFSTTDTQIYAAVARQDQMRTYEQWIKGIEEEAGVHWEREPRLDERAMM